MTEQRMESRDDDILNEDDPELDELNETAEANGEHGYWFRTMEGDVVWCEAPESERCGGHGSMVCYCGGDFCVCGNQGTIDCMGCEDCERDDSDDEDADDWQILGARDVSDTEHPAADD